MPYLHMKSKRNLRRGLRRAVKAGSPSATSQILRRLKRRERTPRARIAQKG